MPACCVAICTNRTEKGFSMRKFPANVERREKWIESINTHNRIHGSKWRATQNLFAHFLAEMWETIRVDGKKKLKANAVPTIFNPISDENMAYTTDSAVPFTSEPECFLTDVNDAKGLPIGSIEMDEMEIT
ncbi:hypothetical protein X777_04034, partial [Ooceraea biroi]